MSAYQFNSPIGYSKKPLFYDEGKITNDFINHGSHSSHSMVSNSNVSLDKLPAEILDKIIHYLDQFDSFKLLQANKAMYTLVKPKLYENIIIDSGYSQFNKEYAVYKYQHQTQITHTKMILTSTFIKSTYNLKKFLNNYSGAPIRRFQCISMPDSISLVDNEINELITTFFTKVKCINELVWVPDNFHMKFLDGLQKDDLISLIINTKFYHDSLRILKEFPNLINVQIGPYASTTNLTTLVNSIQLQNLEVVKIKKFDKETSVPDPPSQNLLVDGLNDLYDYEIQDLRILCGSPLPNVTKLSLDGIIVQSTDSYSLKNAVRLHNLVKFELRNLFEVKQAANDSFLADLAGELPRLQQLVLDYRESSKDNVPVFLEKTGPLQKLDLVIRTNATKPFDEKAYAKALKSHSSTITHLSIEVKKETSLNFASVPISLQLYELHQLQNLQSLRINSTNELDNLTLIGSLPRLRYLSLFGLKAGGSPNLGLGMVHPTVFDEWFKVQHVALIYLNNNSNLAYIKINQCLFECKDKVVVPRDGIDNWFEEIVRIRNIDFV